jgi:hypothetical protein
MPWSDDSYDASTQKLFVSGSPWFIIIAPILLLPSIVASPPIFRHSHIYRLHTCKETPPKDKKCL